MEKSSEVAEKYSEYKNIALIGIGGSNLWTIAIHEALGKTAEKHIEFFDTVDSEATERWISMFEEKLKKWERCVIIVISKSGTTTETLALADILYKRLFLRFREYISIVTLSDPHSKLDTLAQTEWWERLHIPPMVGGRYSVLSSVGIFPLELLGYDTNELIRWAREIIELYLQNPTDSPINERARLLYNSFAAGRNIHEHWFFSKKLESLGKWYRQLLAESIGKVQADWTSVGITPSTAIGTTDLHSIAQLNLAHTGDKVISIVWLKGQESTLLKVSNSPFTSILPNIVWKEHTTIMQAALLWFEKAVWEKNIPHTVEYLEDNRAYDIGRWMASRMLEVALLGEMFWVNPFDQPNVEDYKIHMKKALG